MLGISKRSYRTDTSINNKIFVAEFNVNMSKKLNLINFSILLYIMQLLSYVLSLKKTVQVQLSIKWAFYENKVNNESKENVNAKQWQFQLKMGSYEDICATAVHAYFHCIKLLQMFWQITLLASTTFF